MLADAPKARAIQPEFMRLAQERRQTLGKRAARPRAEHQDKQAGSGKQEKGLDLNGFRDIAAFKRLFKPSLCRLFCLVVLVLFLGHQATLE